MGIEARILPPYEEHHDGDFDGYSDCDHHRDHDRDRDDGNGDWPYDEYDDDSIGNFFLRQSGVPLLPNLKE